MSTSRDSWLRARTSPARFALEAVVLAAALAFLPEWLGAGAGAGADAVSHPGWIAVLVLAARYGGSGLVAGLTAAAGAVALGALASGEGLAAPWPRVASGHGLIAFAACLAVSWIASWHLRRQAELAERLKAAADRATQADATIRSLYEALSALRSRVDRTSSSLSFLRDAASRLEGPDPMAGAQGAADLALARAGARAAAVAAGANGTRRLLAVRDARGPGILAPLALDGADLTVPIRRGEEPVGELVLWGVARSSLDGATAHDLDVIASWCGRALVETVWHLDSADGSMRRVS